jgi:hypothetical protein
LNGCDIYCNRIFASLISNKINNYNLKFPEDDFIDFLNSPDPEIIKLFFDIIRCKSIWMNGSNQELISDIIHFIEFGSLSVLKMTQDLSFYYVSKNIFSLIPLPLYSIQSIISSYFLSLKNEDQLFEFFKGLTSENKYNFSLLKYLHFGLVSFNSFTQFITSIQLNEVDSCLFDHMKYSFFTIILFLMKIKQCTTLPNIFFSS